MVSLHKTVKIGLLSIAMLLSVNAIAQKAKKVTVENIKADTTYYYGIGSVCTKPEQAVESAYEELYRNIALNCRPNAFYIHENGEVRVQIVNIVKTFQTKIAEKTLNTIIPIKEDAAYEQYQYLIYIKRYDFRQMCDEKTSYIRSYLSEAARYEKDRNYEYALKYYYWGLVLCYSHPYARNLQINVDGLENKIRDILQSFHFIVLPYTDISISDTAEIKLRVTDAESRDVLNLKCQYNNGSKFVSALVKEGFMTVYPVKKINPLVIRVLCDFDTDAYSQILVADAAKYIKFTYPERVHHVDLTNRMKINPWPKPEQGFKDEECIRKMVIIEKALREGQPSKARECFSREGYGMFDTLFRYGKIRVLDRPYYRFIRFNGEIICRGLEVQFSIRNKYEFSQELSFRFDEKTKLVTSLAFSLTNTAENDIMAEDRTWPMESKLVLMNFLEDYQTAYALKRHKYIQRIYSDSALIIVGHVLKTTNLTDTYKLNAPQEEIRRVKYDKKTYMENLARCFNTQEFIRLYFTDTDFRKDQNNDKLYGISVRQEYTSSTYSDVGYLLLIVDLNGEMPIIHVRTWQPDKPGIRPYKMWNFRDN